MEYIWTSYGLCRINRVAQHCEHGHMNTLVTCKPPLCLTKLYVTGKLLTFFNRPAAWDRDRDNMGRLRDFPAVEIKGAQFFANLSGLNRLFEGKNNHSLQP